MSKILKQVIDKCKSHATIVAWLSALVIIAVLLLIYEYHVLWKIQEQSLFLNTSLFFRELMTVPGGLLTYAGCFLTQLLYHPVLGVAVLCALWWLLMALMRRTFRVGEPWSMLLLVPVEGAAPLGQGGVTFARVLMYAALALTVVSGADYIVRNRDCIKDM